MSTIPRDDIAHLAKLTRLNLTDEQIERYTQQFGSILTFVETLNQVPTNEAAKETSKRGVTGISNHVSADALRSEESLANLDPQLALKSAPRTSGRYIQVRAVLAGEEESA